MILITDLYSFSLYFSLQFILIPTHFLYVLCTLYNVHCTPNRSLDIKDSSALFYKCTLDLFLIFFQNIL